MATVPYPTEKLLSVSNAQTWDYYFLDSMSAYPVIGSAIRNGKKFVLPVPSAEDTMINSLERKYNFSIIDGQPVLTKTSRNALRIAQDKFILANDKRIEEEAKVCTLLKSSFSEEISMMLRSNLEYVNADNSNDSFEMYRLVKALTARTSRFEVAQNRLLQLFQCRMTSTHTAYKDEILTHYKVLQTLFGSNDPATPDSCQLADFVLVAYLGGLPDDGFQYPKDKIYADNPAGTIPNLHQVMQSMTIYDTNKRKVPPTAAYEVPAGPTVLAAIHATTTTCSTCHTSFPTIISRRTGLPFTNCQSCNKKFRDKSSVNPPVVPTVVPTSPQVSTGARLQSAHNALLAATTAYHHAHALATGNVHVPPDPGITNTADYLNNYIYQQSYNL